MEKHMNKENRDLLIELRTQNTEILRRLTEYDKIIVPRTEYSVMVSNLQKQHTDNQKQIENIQNQIRGIIWKVGGGLGSLQIITSLILYLITRS